MKNNSSKKAMKQILRISSMLRNIRNAISDEEELNIQNLINIDFCNESILRIIASEYQLPTDKSIYKIWDSINTFLKNNNSSFCITELPNKSDILLLIHEKRNFTQHSGECPTIEEIESYFEISQRFIKSLAEIFLSINIENYSIIDLVKNSGYKSLLKMSQDYYLKGEYFNAATILRHSFDLATQILFGRDNLQQHGYLSSKFKEAFKSTTKENERFYLSQFDKVFDMIDRKMHLTFSLTLTLIKGSLKLPDRRFENIEPATVIMTMNKKLHCYMKSENIPHKEDIEYAISYCVKIFTRLESLNLLPEYDFENNKPIIA